MSNDTRTPGQRKADAYDWVRQPIHTRYIPQPKIEEPIRFTITDKILLGCFVGGAVGYFVAAFMGWAP